MPRRPAERYEFQGKMLTLNELAEISSWSRTQLWHRLKREKMEPAKAVAPLKADMPKTKPKPNGKPHLYTYKGKEYTLAQLAEIAGIPKNAMRYRVAHWTMEEAVNEVTHEWPNSKKITVMTPDGEKTMTMTQWAAYRDIELMTISQRRTRGWTDEQALEYAPSPLELTGRPIPPSRSLKARTPEGEMEMTIKQWSAYRNIREQTIKQRIIRGWSNEQALGYIRPPSRNGKRNAK